jgi:transaldolase
MSLLLDSAFVEDARITAALGFVQGGITTNPTLLAKTGLPAETVIPALCDTHPGTIFHQLAAPTLKEREAEAWHFLSLRPGRVGLKIPCTLENLTLARRFADQGAVTAMTAIFSPAQVYLALQAGADFIFPYVNRSTKLLGDGLALIRQMRAVIDAEGGALEIAAASIKNPEQAVDTILAGAHHLTLPLEVIQAMAKHPLSLQTIAEFDAAGK